MRKIFKGPPVLWWIESGDDRHAEFYEQTLAWVRGLDLDPSRLRPEAAVVLHNGVYELHVDEIVRNTDRSLPGGDRFDPLDEDNLLSIRRIITVEKDSWPTMPDRSGMAV